VNENASMARSSEQPPFTSEIVGSILTAPEKKLKSIEWKLDGPLLEIEWIFDNP
jgi:hypothetical protein